MSLHDDVDREALHDWLNERPPREVPSRDEIEDDEPDTTFEDAIDVLGRAASTPWPPQEGGAPRS